MDPFTAFLSSEMVLDDDIEAKKLQMKEVRYCLLTWYCTKNLSRDRTLGAQACQLHRQLW